MAFSAAARFFDEQRRSKKSSTAPSSSLFSKVSRDEKPYDSQLIAANLSSSMRQRKKQQQKTQQRSNKHDGDDVLSLDTKLAEAYVETEAKPQCSTKARQMALDSVVLRQVDFLAREMLQGFNHSKEVLFSTASGDVEALRRCQQLRKQSITSQEDLSRRKSIQSLLVKDTLKEAEEEVTKRLQNFECRIKNIETASMQLLERVELLENHIQENERKLIEKVSSVLPEAALRFEKRAQRRAIRARLLEEQQLQWERQQQLGQPGGNPSPRLSRNQSQRVPKAACKKLGITIGFTLTEDCRSPDSPRISSDLETSSPRNSNGFKNNRNSKGSNHSIASLVSRPPMQRTSSNCSENIDDPQHLSSDIPTAAAKRLGLGISSDIVTETGRRSFEEKHGWKRRVLKRNDDVIDEQPTPEKESLTVESALLGFIATPTRHRRAMTMKPIRRVTEHEK